MTTHPVTHPTPSARDTTALRRVRLLVGVYSAISILTVVAIVVLSQTDPDDVNDNAWVRGIIVAATSLLTFVFASRALQGHPRALLRLRIVVPIILVAVVLVLFLVPLPTWMVVEQTVVGVLVAATAVLLFGRRFSSAA